MRALEDTFDQSDSPAWISMSDVLILTTVLLIGATVGVAEYATSQRLIVEQQQQRMSALDETQRRLAQLTQQLDLVRRQAALAAAQLKESKTAAEVTRGERDRLKTMLEAADRDRERLSLRIATLVNERDSLARKLADSAKQRNRLNAMLTAAAKELANLKTRVEELQQHVAQLENERNRAANALTQANKTNEVLQAKAQAALEEAQRSERLLRQELLGLRSRSGRFQRVVVLIDRSGSMMFAPGSGHDLKKKRDAKESARRWEYVRGILELWLQLLPFDEVALVIFNHEVVVFPSSGGYLSVRGDTERQQLLNYLKALEPEGGTNTLGALQTALTYDSPDALILFTDGAPTITPLKNDSRSLHDQVLDLVRAYAREPAHRAPINVVGVGDYFTSLSGSENRPMRNPALAGQSLSLGRFLQDIAEITGGTFIGK